MAVCLPCKSAPHSSQPEYCRGGTWCDCQHRLPKPDPIQVVEVKEEKTENEQRH